MVADTAQRLFTIDEYECMGTAEILQADERVELLEGKIYTMAPMAVPHWDCVLRFDEALKESLPRTVHVLVQLPVHLPPRSAPEPDIAVVRRRADGYMSGIAGPDDILLLVEVSDSTRLTDRNRKLPMYAEAGIPETWLAVLNGNRIWIYRSPANGQYQDVTSVGRGETISPLAFPDVRLAVDDLLPPVAAA